VFIIRTFVIGAFILQLVAGNDTEKDTPDEERPEGVETVQEYKRSEDLPFHPPNHPNTLTWRPTTRRMWNQIEVFVHRPEHDEVEVVTEIRPNPDKYNEKVVLGALPMEIVD